MSLLVKVINMFLWFVGLRLDVFINHFFGYIVRSEIVRGKRVMFSWGPPIDYRLLIREGETKSEAITRVSKYYQEERLIRDIKDKQ